MQELNVYSWFLHTSSKGLSTSYLIYSRIFFSLCVMIIFSKKKKRWGTLLKKKSQLKLLELKIYVEIMSQCWRITCMAFLITTSFIFIHLNARVIFIANRTKAQSMHIQIDSTPINPYPCFVPNQSDSHVNIIYLYDLALALTVRDERTPLIDKANPTDQNSNQLLLAFWMLPLSDSIAMHLLSSIRIRVGCCCCYTASHPKALYKLVVGVRWLLDAYSKGTHALR